MPGPWDGHARTKCQMQLDQLTDMLEQPADTAELPAGHTETIHWKNLNYLPDMLEPTAGHVGTTTQTVWNHALEIPESGPGHTGITLRTCRNQKPDNLEAPT